MSSELITNQVSTAAMEKVIMAGDLSALTPAAKLNYYNSVCQSLGLNPLTQPFAFIKLNGKETLYAKRDCADQLRKIHKISITISARETISGLFVVTAKASSPDGRQDESTGAVAIEKLSGDALANAFLKSETKAKRRVTLSICGLGFLDESEVDSIPEARKVNSQTENKAAEDVGQGGSESQPRLDQQKAPNWYQEQHDIENKIKEDEKIERQLENPGDYIVKCGKKYKGQCLAFIDSQDISDFMKWIKSKPKGKDDKPIDVSSPDYEEFLFMADLYLKQPKKSPQELIADAPWNQDPPPPWDKDEPLPF